MDQKNDVILNVCFQEADTTTENACGWTYSFWENLCNLMLFHSLDAYSVTLQSYSSCLVVIYNSTYMTLCLLCFLFSKLIIKFIIKP